MRIPPKIDNILRKDTQLHSNVHSILNGAMSEKIKWKQLDFFPEYTNHGSEHIERVLSIASDLIHEDSEELLTPLESAVLVLSIAFHDLGMYITVDGFNALLHGKLSKQHISHLHDKHWSSAWDSFFAETQKYNDQQILALYGEHTNISLPSFNDLNMTKKDKLLIGEFIRRNHHRLAHELIVYGFPTNDENFKFINETPISNASNIIGFIARSHGLSLRDSIQLSKKLFGDIAFSCPSNIRIFYLMALLRLADYLDASYERAPHILSVTRNISSLTSKKEWSWNQVINPNYIWMSEKEYLYIPCLPDNSELYLKTSKWIKAVQYELDISWAILGEMYGIKNDTLKLSIRRIEFRCGTVKKQF